MNEIEEILRGYKYTKDYQEWIEKAIWKPPMSEIEKAARWYIAWGKITNKYFSLYQSSAADQSLYDRWDTANARTCKAYERLGRLCL